MRPAAVQHDYAADDLTKLANQIEQIAERAGNQNQFAEVEVIFYQGELRSIVKALRSHPQ